MMTREEILKAEEIYVSDFGLMIPMVLKNVGYIFDKNSLTWFVQKRYYSWKVYNKRISPEEALDLMDSWERAAAEKNELLGKAISFAAEKHAGQVRKGTHIPYIVHPMEVLQILYSMRADTYVMIAGVLHDTVEDTDTSLEEIRELFGDYVAELVASNSEDKSKSWDERKQHTIDALPGAQLDVQMLILADKLSNLRSIAYDYKNIKDKLWERFNAPKEKQAWYYGGIQDGLYDIQFAEECESAYWEFVGLYKDVFVKYYLDEANDTLYQQCDDGSAFYLKKGDSQWYDAREVAIPECCEVLSRRDAEFLEDVWNMRVR